MKISLTVILAGGATGRSLPIMSPQFIIGRDPECNLRPASVMISKRHCAVLVKNNQVFLRDFDSTNGTFLNEHPVKGEVSLSNSDVLRVGPLSFKVSIEGLPAPSKPTPQPKPKNTAATPNDADSIAYLAFADEDGDVSVEPIQANEELVPCGTTAMEIPIFLKETLASSALETQTSEKPEEEPKPAAKPANKTGAAQDAAKTLLDRLRTGKRK
ncbi:MAG: FHA domain-containing protein [Gemmataceae bacterium]|nr:FHA domain-containing protein [Gemmataceae bacterium]